MLARQVITITIAVSMLLFDGPGLVRGRRWGELGTHAVLTATALVLALLPSFNVEVPSLIEWLMTKIRPLGDAIFRWFSP
jgi:hypothetical protein